MIKLDYRRFGHFKGPHVAETKEFQTAAPRVVLLHDLLLEGKDPLLKDGPVVMTGWKTESPFVSDSELDTIQSVAQKLAAEVDDFVSIGIGGSYLGIHSVIDAVRGSIELTNLLSGEKEAAHPASSSWGTTWIRLTLPGFWR